MKRIRWEDNYSSVPYCTACSKYLSWEHLDCWEHQTRMRWNTPKSYRPEKSKKTKGQLLLMVWARDGPIGSDLYDVDTNIEEFLE